MKRLSRSTHESSCRSRHVRMMLIVVCYGMVCGLAADAPGYED